MATLLLVRFVSGISLAIASPNGDALVMTLASSTTKSGRIA